LKKDYGIGCDGELPEWPARAAGRRDVGEVLADGEIKSMNSAIFGRFAFRLLMIVGMLAGVMSLAATPLKAQEYTAREIVDSGHRFFGATSGGLATAVETIFSSYGLPNGYVLGEEGSGAFVGGLTYGEGKLFTKNAGDHKVFWQGPSLGFDFGGEGSRIMMLVYNLDQVDALYDRFVGVAGSAYVVAGVGFNVLKQGDVLLVPVRTGVGARLGINVGYLKLTRKATWNPF
jgi:hypothetical protein